MANLSKEEKERRKLERREKKFRETHKIINGVDHKLCNEGNHWLPSTTEYFYGSKSNSIDRLQPLCKQCNINKTLQWEKDNPEKLKINRKRTNDNRKDKLYEYGLISSQRGSRKAWWRSNPHKTKEYIERYSMNKGHEISEEEREICFEYFDYKCAYCGLDEKDSLDIFNQRLHRDHVVNNGSNKVDNCVPACMSCNVSKKDKELSEWYTDDVNKHFTKERLDKIYSWINGDWELHTDKLNNEEEIK